MTQSSALLTKKRSMGREHARVPVTRLASGVDLGLTLHVASGAKPGPTVGIISTVHGDETWPLIVVRELLASLDLSALSGRVAVIPVANPPAVTVFGRQTPEQHGKTDLHEVFPGLREGNLTQRLAHAISTNLLDHVDALVDIHCGGLGGRLQNRADLDASAPPDVYEKSLSLCKAFNSPFVHSNNLAGTAARYCNSKKIPTVNPEVGGVYLGHAADEEYTRELLTGLRSVMASMGMMTMPAMTTKKQLLFAVKSRFETNPSVGGYLRSFFDKPSDLGRKIEKGTVLGEMVDIHTLEVVEELKASVTGHMFFSRYSGVVDAGTKAFALAEETTSSWL